MENFSSGWNWMWGREPLFLYLLLCTRVLRMRLSIFSPCWNFLSITKETDAIMVIIKISSSLLFFLSTSAEIQFKIYGVGVLLIYETKNQRDLMFWRFCTIKTYLSFKNRFGLGLSFIGYKILWENWL